MHGEELTCIHNRSRCATVVLIMGLRRRRWPMIKTTLIQHLVIAVFQLNYTYRPTLFSASRQCFLGITHRHRRRRKRHIFSKQLCFFRGEHEFLHRIYDVRKL